MHYKKGKHQDKEVGWHSPKRYQPGGDLEIMHPCSDELDHEAIYAEFESDVKEMWTELVPKLHKKRRAVYCKRLKGPHDYGEWQKMMSSYSNKPIEGVWQRFCKACQKKDWWAAPYLPGNRLDHDPNVKPPGYSDK